MRKLKALLLILIGFAIQSEAFSQSDMAKMLMDTPQKPLVYKEIELEVTHPSSNYYYPPLFERYEKGDTTLTVDDYRHLYYGYMFNDDYRPHTEPKYVDSLSVLLNKSQGAFTQESLVTAIRYLDSILVERPFSLKFLNLMTYVYSEKVRDMDKALYYAYKYNMILSAIFSTGSGVSSKSPWIVLYRVDAQTVLSTIGADVARRNYITANIEYYFLKERQGDVRGYYFDFHPIYTRRIEVNSKRKMEVNPMYNPKSDKHIKNN